MIDTLQDVKNSPRLDGYLCVRRVSSLYKEDLRLGCMFTSENSICPFSFAVALSLQQQILPSPEKVPSDERDESLDATISQSGVLATDGKSLAESNGK